MFFLKVSQFITDCFCKRGLWPLIGVLLALPWSMFMTVVMMFDSILHPEDSK